MNVSLVEVAGANFRTDEKSDELNTKFMERLGMQKRYLPARLAIARSLAKPGSFELSGSTQDSGKVIKGDTLFGTGTTLSVWLALIMERSEQPDMNLKQLLQEVGAHWRRGIELLDRDWKQAGEDVPQFVKLLVEVADLPASGRTRAGSVGDESVQVVSSGLIEVPIGEVGEDVATGEKVAWNLNGRGGSPHCAVMGGVGTGKTRTAVSMLQAIREHAKVPLLTFDFKDDLTADSGGDYQLDKDFEAKVLEPPRTPIPLDVLWMRSTSDIDIAEAASRFRDSFGRLKGSRLGAKQRTAVHDAVSSALKSQAAIGSATDTRAPCELTHIKQALKMLYEEREWRDDGATSTMEEICRHPLFAPTYQPSEFFKRSWVIKLPPNVPEDSRTIVVNLLLDALDQHLNSLADTDLSPDGARGLRILCMIDEAHQILKNRLPSLSSLIRMSRSKGGAIMLISQSPDDFSGEDDEFLSEMGLVVAFATNASSRHVTRILGKGTNLGALQDGQCFAKRRGDQTSKKIKAW